jgi:hypothetical protein
MGAQLERIDARVCRMERKRPALSRGIVLAGDAPMAIRVGMPARAVRLLDLHAELLVLIAAQLAEDDELAASLACRKLREAVAGTERRAAGARLSTRIGSAFDSVVKLEWATACGMPLCGALLTRAARHGQLEQLSWLRSRGCAWEPLDEESNADNTMWPHGWHKEAKDPCASAAVGGHLAVLQWAHANGCPWDEWTCSWAAKGGHLAVLQWARANGCLWDPFTCAQAAEGGHLALLQWARANGCARNLLTCSSAAEGGHLAVLQWARANGCEWDPN